jgi:chaperone required for assembly of F1-ATPase
MKRFWSSTAAQQQDDGFTILLDDKHLRLPGSGPLNVPFPALATAIATEWAQAGGEPKKDFTPDDLPLTRLASTAQIRIRQHRPNIIAQLAAYGMNDLLCYRADNQPELAELEAATWQPWLDWSARTHGTQLQTTTGILPITQNPENLAAFTTALNQMTDYQLAALGVITPLLGSLILGLALTAGALTPDAAVEIAHLGETWQEQRWGTDAEAAARRLKILEDIAISTSFMALCAA